VGINLVILIGHTQAQHMVKTQPMKMAAAEALRETADPAGLSLFATIDQENQRNGIDIRLPGFLSFLTHNKFSGEVRGIKDIQKEYEVKYKDIPGTNNYIPPVWLTFWSFRIMVGLGGLMFLLALLGWWKARSDTLTDSPWLLKLSFWALLAPFLANSFGWIMTEIGRQPWIVFGVMKTEAGLSKAVSPGEALFGFLTYIVVYTVLIFFFIYLMKKYARMDPGQETAADAA